MFFWIKIMLNILTFKLACYPPPPALAKSALSLVVFFHIKNEQALIKLALLLVYYFIVTYIFVLSIALVTNRTFLPFKKEASLLDIFPANITAIFN